MRKECPRTTDFGHALQKTGGLCACIANGSLFLRINFAGRPDCAHGLRTEGFVHVNVLCVVIVLVIFGVFVFFVMDMFDVVVMLDYTSFNVSGLG